MAKAKRQKKGKKKRKWIKGAIKHPGALRKELGVPEGENIPPSKLKIKKGDSTRTKQRKNLAKRLAKLRKKRKKK